MTKKKTKLKTNENSSNQKKRKDTGFKNHIIEYDANYLDNSNSHE